MDLTVVYSARATSLLPRIVAPLYFERLGKLVNSSRGIRDPLRRYNAELENGTKTLQVLRRRLSLYAFHSGHKNASLVLLASCCN